ncbi:hypothetical protein GCM10023069_13260 [Shinella granuli]
MPAVSGNGRPYKPRAAGTAAAMAEEVRGRLQLQVESANIQITGMDGLTIKTAAFKLGETRGPRDSVK